MRSNVNINRRIRTLQQCAARQVVLCFHCAPQPSQPRSFDQASSALLPHNGPHDNRTQNVQNPSSHLLVAPIIYVVYPSVVTSLLIQVKAGTAMGLQNFMRVATTRMASTETRVACLVAVRPYFSLRTRCGDSHSATAKHEHHKLPRTAPSFPSHVQIQ